LSTPTPPRFYFGGGLIPFWKFFFFQILQTLFACFGPLLSPHVLLFVLEKGLFIVVFGGFFFFFFWVIRSGFPLSFFFGGSPVFDPQGSQPPSPAWAIVTPPIFYVAAFFFFGPPPPPLISAGVFPPLVHFGTFLHLPSQCGLVCWVGLLNFFVSFLFPPPSLTSSVVLDGTLFCTGGLVFFFLFFFFFPPPG